MVLENDVLAPHLHGLLNRVTHLGVVENIALELSSVMLDHCGKLSVDKMEFIAELVYKRALAESRYCEALAHFAQRLRNVLPEVEDATVLRNFQAYLLNLCQNEFEEKLFSGSPLGILALTITTCFDADELRVSCCDLGGTERFVAWLPEEARLSALVSIVKKHCGGYCVHDVDCFDGDGASEVPQSRKIIECNNLVLRCSVETMEHLTPEEIEQRRQELRTARLAFMKFIGQLLLARCVCSRVVAAIMHGVVAFVDAGVLTGEDAIESICKLLSEVGPKLDKGPREHVLIVSDACEKMTNMKCKSTRVRILLQNLLERRKSWTRT